MAQFTKDSELDTTLGSGITASDRRTCSTHFDQRRVLNASGVVVNSATSKTYTADGYYKISDFYPLTFNATGILQVNIREQRNCGNVVILNASGVEIIEASPSKLSSRQNSITTRTINASGTHYAYVELYGRSSASYKIGIDLYSS
jgi:hypothetical protein